MTDSISSAGSARSRQDVAAQNVPPPAARPFNVAEDRDVSGTDATQRRATRPATTTADAVFAETARRSAAAAGEGGRSGGSESVASPEETLPRGMPRGISIPQLQEGARLPAPLEVEYDRVPASQAGSTDQTVSTISSAGRTAPHPAAASLPTMRERADDPSLSEASIHDDDDSSVGGFVDIEAQITPPISKEPLGRLAFSARIERANLIDAVKTHAVLSPLAELDPAKNTDLAASFACMIRELNSAINNSRREVDDAGTERVFDIESGKDITGLLRFRDKMEEGFAKVTEDLGKLSESKTDFMSFKTRQAMDKSTATDKIQRNLFGSELHAVINRSVLQSVLVVGASAGLQVATVAALQRFFTNHPDHIPGPALVSAREALGPDAAEADVVKKAVDGLATPGSTYLDENTSTEGAIYGTEAVVGFGRGVIVPMADSINETDARAASVQKAVENIYVEKPTPTRAERASDAFKNAWGPQIKANMYSGAVAATISTATTKATTGPDVLIEVGKTMGFSAISAVNNAAADGFRKAVYDGKSEAVSQTIKATSRVAGRVLAQGIKTGVSIAQSAGEGKLSNRSFAADAIKAVMQSAVSGGVKEGLGAAFQNATNARLPPNETAMQQVGNSLGSLAKFTRDLASLEIPVDLSPEGQLKKQEVSNMIASALARVLEANAIKFEAIDFDVGHHVYKSELDQQITAARSENA